jgi:hypothetical protein
MVPAVPREEPVPNVSAVSMVPIVFQHGNTPINLWCPRLYARASIVGTGLAVVDQVGRPEPEQRDVSDPIRPNFHVAGILETWK